MSVTSFNHPVDGIVLEVSEMPTSTNLSQAATTGNTTIYVDDVTDFSEDGGQLLLNDVTYSYLSTDESLSSITLSSALTGPADQNTQVIVLPLSYEKWALVYVNPGEDAIRARIPHTLADRFVTGIREEEDRESVLVHVERTEWTVLDIVALAPEVDGGYLIPASVDESKVTFDAHTLGAQRIFQQSTAPSGMVTDDLWIDTANGNVMKRYNGTSWVLIDDSRIAQVVNSDATKVSVFAQTSAPSSTGRVTGDIWIDIDDNEKVYRWSGSWVLTDISSKNYVISRGTDLVTNGTGTLGNNTNFSLFAFVTNDAPAGAAGSFDTTLGVTATLQNDEYMPVDPSKEFLLSYQAKQKGTTGYLYGGLAPYDAFKQSISPSYVMYTANTLTTLAAPLNPGDTTVTLTSSVNWYGSASKPAGASTHLRSIIWWDYTDPGGKLWPELTYSRNWSGSNYWADGGITGNVITLSAPYSGPSRPAGTKLSNGSSGGNYMYGGAVNALVPTSWTFYSASIKGYAPAGGAPAMGAGNGWPQGVAYARALFLVNRTSAGAAEPTSKHSIALVSLSDASAASAVANNALTLAGHITTYYQTSQPATGMLSGDLWIDTDDSNKLYRYNGTTWQVAQDQGIGAAITAAAGAQATADGKVKLYAQISAPTGLLATDDGDLWVDTDDSNKLYRFNGGTLAWVLIQDAGGALAQANVALTAANGKSKVTWSTSSPGTAANSAGDIWFVTGVGGGVIAQWQGQGGTSWVSQPIQDAVITSITAAKLTTGSLGVGNEIIAGDPAASNARMTSDGFKVFVEDLLDGVPNEVVRMGSSSNDVFAVTNSASETVASISDEGVGSLAGLSVDTDPITLGYPLIGKYGASIYDVASFSTDPSIARNYEDEPIGLLESYSKGSMTWWGGNIGTLGMDVNTINNQQRGLFELGFDLEAGRQYEFEMSDMLVEMVAGGLCSLVAYATYDGSVPTFTSAVLGRSYANGSTGQYVTVGFRPRLINGTGSGTQDQIRVLVALLAQGGATVKPFNLQYVTAAIVDRGPTKEISGTVRTSYVTGGSTPAPAPKPYTKTYASTSAATYQGGGAKRTDTTDVVQGYNSFNGDGKGLWIFPSMTADLAGATVTKVEIYAYANHWYYNSGGSALIKVHGYTSAPASSPSMTTAKTQASWPNPGGKWVTLPSSLYAGFKSGTYRGFGMGPSGGTNLLYYGRFNGGTSARIRVTYTK